MWESLGPIRWPLLFSLVSVVVLTVWTGTQLFGRTTSANLRTKAWVDAVLFWGGFGVVSGVLGTLLGFIVAAQSIEAAGAVSPTLMWGGMKIAMLSAVFGLLILVFASLSWFVLQMRWRLLAARLVDA